MPIAPDEEAGLRAFTIRIGVEEASTDHTPRWLEASKTRIDVRQIDAQWREEERIGFRVTLADASCWLLYYVPELDLWSGIADLGAVGGAQAAPRWRQGGSS